jgi:hypothetical protein
VSKRLGIGCKRPRPHTTLRDRDNVSPERGQTLTLIRGRRTRPVRLFPAISQFRHPAARSNHSTLKASQEVQAHARVDRSGVPNDMVVSWSLVKDVAAILGGVLGVFNFAQGFWQRKVRLRVIPKLTAIRGGGFLSNQVDSLPDGFACIEVTNLGVFPVTIAEVGFSLIGEKRRSIIIPEPLDLLPKRLEPRQSIDIRATKSAGFPRKAKRAFATTQCGHTQYGDSPVLKKSRKESNKLLASAPHLP